MSTITQLAEGIEKGLRGHIDECQESERQQFGGASRYDLDVTVHDENTLIRVVAAAAPIPEVEKAFGRTRPNPSFISSDPIQQRFFAREYQYRYDPATNVIAFHVGHHTGLKRASVALLDDPYFYIWKPRRENRIARHLTGRIPWDFATDCGATGMERKAEKRARQVIEAFA